MLLKWLGANKATKTISKAGTTIATVDRICRMFEEQTSTCQARSHRHPYPSFSKDLDTILKVLEEEVFIPKERQHSTFSLRKPLLQKLSHAQLIAKVQSTVEQIYFV